jgi:dihydroorotate dehydrogenase
VRVKEDCGKFNRTGLENPGTKNGTKNDRFTVEKEQGKDIINSDGNEILRKYKIYC